MEVYMLGMKNNQIDGVYRILALVFLALSSISCPGPVDPFCADHTDCPIGKECDQPNGQCIEKPELEMLTKPPLENAKAGVTYEIQLEASGGVGHLTWLMVGNPKWLSLDSATGKLFGTPPTKDTNGDEFEVTVKDEQETSIKRIFDIRVDGCVLGDTLACMIALEDTCYQGIHRCNSETGIFQPCEPEQPVIPSDDPAFCGADCKPCDEDLAPDCVNGACLCGAQQACLNGTTCCDGNCTDTLTDSVNCGTCGTKCTDEGLSEKSTRACEQGNCDIQECEPGYANCYVDLVGCETKLGTLEHCSGCTDKCPAFEHASSKCAEGGCQMGACESGYDNCNADPNDGCETTLKTATDCLGCDDDCTQKYDHAEGVCGPSGCAMGKCVGDWGDCDKNPSTGCETKLKTDLNCQGCGDNCTTRFPNADGDCGGNGCVMGSCTSPFENCDGSSNNGCEIKLGSRSNCSGCGDSCADDYPHNHGKCENFKCQPGDCHTGWGDCDNNPHSNGCEINLSINRLHCGACNHQCPKGQICTNGKCEGIIIKPCFGDPCETNFDCCEEAPECIKYTCR